MKLSKRHSNLLKKAAIISSLCNLYVTEVNFRRTAFKHVVGVSLSTFKPIPGRYGKIKNSVVKLEQKKSSCSYLGNGRIVN